MKLSALVENLAGFSGNDDPEITGLSADSRAVRAGFLFCALPGSRTDGAKFIEDALYHGAVAVLAPPGVELPPGAEAILLESENPRHTLSLLAARFYARQPDMIAAVTGTNGKTSVADFTRQIWAARGIKAASLGTLGLRGPSSLDRKMTVSMTTPDPVALHAVLADLSAAGIDHLALEASSHGLHQHRLDGVLVRAAGFTNLSRDHLDYHPDMESYFAAKLHLFSAVLADEGTAVLNADIPEYPAMRQMVLARGLRLLSYGYQGEDIRITSRETAPEGQALRLNVYGHEINLTLKLVGEFQVMNALCALGLVLAGNDDDPVGTAALLAELEGVPGRLQLVPGHPGGAVYVDYAHTPDALENILNALRPHTKGRLICLIGCGGDRDSGKRPVMGRVASELADLAVITDDNPRSEDPAAIRAAMMEGAPGALEIAGRREAIMRAVAETKPGDVLVIAGKGHEQGQIIGDKVEPFDDVTEAKNAIDAISEGKRD